MIRLRRRITPAGLPATGATESAVDVFELYRQGLLYPDKSEPAHGAEAITLPGGRRLAFDRYLDLLRGKPNASHAED